MAFVGMKYVVAAKLKTAEPGQKPVYDPGFVVGKGIEAVVTYNRAANVLRADDADAESDNGITGGTLSLNVDDIADAVLADITGNDKTTEDEYDETNEASPYVGVGYMRTRRHQNVTSYVAYWIWKTALGIDSETATTKQETTQWQTPSLNGNMLAVQPDTTMKSKFRRRKTFATEKEARDWLNAMAGIEEAA